jgi:uncharacterized protein
MNWIQLNSAFTLFLSLLVEAVPFLLLGVLFSGLLQFFVDERKLVQMMPRNAFLGALAGSCLGFLFPVCECGNVPVARRLLMQGVPSSVAIGFLLAAPTINPIVFWATWTAFRDQPEMVFLRIACSLIIATVIGWVFSAQRDLRPFLQPPVANAIPSKKGRNEGRAAKDSSSSLLQSGTYFLGQSDQRVDPMDFQAAAIAAAGKPMAYKLSLMLEGMVQEFRELGGVLIFGSAIAALLQVFIPREAILALGQGPITSILAMMLLAAVVSICSTVDSFFALAFSSTFTTGSLLAFLVFGPMIDLKAIGLLLSIFKPRAVFYLMALAAQMTFMFAFIVNLYFS